MSFHLLLKKMKDGQHVDMSDDEDLDPKEYRKILKTQNASMFKLQNYRDTKVGALLVILERLSPRN